MIDITLNIKPYSVNKYFYGNRAIKRRETVEWEMSIIEILRHENIQKKIQDFKDRFDPAKHSIEIEMLFHYPHDVLYTKKKQLSSRAFDLSNVEKPLIDVLFLAKYCTDKIKNLEIDDKYVTKMTSQKLAADTHRIEIKIQLVDLEFEEGK